MDPDVTRVEPYEWVDGEWRSSAQGTGNVSVYLSGISTQDDAMMFARISVAISPEPFPPGIDTPEDLERAEALLQAMAAR
jgi:hypothetical protein